MDQVEEYVSSQRASGQTDEQIKQALTANGWTMEQIQAVFPAPLESNGKPTLVIAVIAILIVIMGTVASIFLFPRKQDAMQVTTEVQTPTTSLPAVVYVKFSPEELGGESSNRQGKFMLFDFSTEQPFSPELPAGHVNDFGKIISPWSLSGEKLFMLGIRENSLPQPLYAYDSKTRKLSYLFDTNSVPEFKGNYSEFSFTSSWIDDSRLSYTASNSVDTSGAIAAITAPKTHYLSNSRLKILQEVINTNPQNATLDGKPLPSLKGIIVGMTSKYIVTLEKPEAKNPMYDLEFQKKLTDTQNEDEAKKMLSQAYKPEGNSIINLYLISNLEEVTSIPWSGDSWAIEAIEPLYSKNSLVIQEVDNNLIASRNRFTVVDLNTPDSRKVITETGRLNKENSIFSEGSIGVTPDEQWLVVFLESDNPDPIGITGKIAAWNLETNKELTICELGCSSVKVYNPNRLRSR